MPITGFVSHALGLTSGVSTYVGPGDVVPGASLWAGFRAYSKATIGARAVQLQSVDFNVLDVNTVAGGGLDIAAINAFSTAHGGIQGAIQLYDQTGNGVNWNVQNFNEIMSFVLNATGTSPALQSDSIDPQEMFATGPALTQPFTISMVAKRTANFTTTETIWNELNSGNTQLAFSNTTNTVRIFAGASVSATATDNIFHAFNAVFNGASSNLNVDGTDNIGDAGATNISTNWQIGTFDGLMTEIGAWPSAISLVGIAANQRAYYNF